MSFRSTAGDDTTLPSAGINYLVRAQDLEVTVDWSRASSATRPASSAVTLQAQVGGGPPHRACCR